MTQGEINDDEWGNPDNWSDGWVQAYFSKKDNRVFVPGRPIWARKRQLTNYPSFWRRASTINYGHRRGLIWAWVIWMLPIAALSLVLWAMAGQLAGQDTASSSHGKMGARAAYMSLSALAAMWLIHTGLSFDSKKWRIVAFALAGVAVLLGASVISLPLLSTRAFFAAARLGDVPELKRMLAENPSLIRATTFWDYTALHFAAQSGKKEGVELLLKAGADVNAKAESRITPLHVAAFEGHADIAELLLKHGANVGAKGYRHDETPLHVAAVHGHVQVIETLLAHGANPGAENMNHETPLDMAREYHQPGAVEALLRGRGP